MNSSRQEYDYTVLFEPAAEGGYVVTCPALPSLVTEGETLEEARKMAKDAMKVIWKAFGRMASPFRKTHRSD